jgi:hypothetical protein
MKSDQRIRLDLEEVFALQLSSLHALPVFTLSAWILAPKTADASSGDEKLRERPGREHGGNYEAEGG